MRYRAEASDHHARHLCTPHSTSDQLPSPLSARAPAETPHCFSRRRQALVAALWAGAKPSPVKKDAAADEGDKLLSTLLTLASSRRPSPRLGVAQSLIGCHLHGPIAIAFGIEPVERRDLRHVVHDDVEAVRVVDQVILVIALGRVEPAERFQRRRDAGVKDMCRRKAARRSRRRPAARRRRSRRWWSGTGIRRRDPGRRPASGRAPPRRNSCSNCP